MWHVTIVTFLMGYSVTEWKCLDAWWGKSLLLPGQACHIWGSYAWWLTGFATILLYKTTLYGLCFRCSSSCENCALHIILPFSNLNMSLWSLGVFMYCSFFLMYHTRSCKSGAERELVENDLSAFGVHNISRLKRGLDSLSGYFSMDDLSDHLLFTPLVYLLWLLWMLYNRAFSIMHSVIQNGCFTWWYHLAVDEK